MTFAVIYTVLLVAIFVIIARDDDRVNLCSQLKSVAHLPWRAFMYKVLVKLSV